MAIYKQVLKVDPQFLDARVKLGEHFQRMGLGSEALRELQEAVNICQERGLKRESFNLLKRVAELDPENIPNRLSLADLLMREGLEEEAREEFSSLLDMVEKEGAADQIVRVSEQMLAHFPTTEHALVAFATAKIKVGMAADAIARLIEMKPEFPESIPFREALVAAYDAVGDRESKSDVYREIAELFKLRGNEDKAREIMQRFVSAQVFTAAGTTSDDPEEPAIADLSAGGLLDFTSQGIGSDAPPEPLEPTKLSAPEPIAMDPPDDDLVGESYEDLVAQAKVELDFGDPDSAARYAQQANQLDPNGTTAREILKKVGAMPDFDGEDTGTLPDIELVLVDDPDDDDSFGSVEPPLEVEMGMNAGVRPSLPESDEFELENEASSDEIEIDLDDLDLPSADLDTPEAAGEASERQETSSSTWAQQSSWVGKTVAAAEAIFGKGLLDEAKMLYEQVLEHAPNHPQAMLRLGEIEAAQGHHPDDNPALLSDDADLDISLGDTQVDGRPTAEVAALSSDDESEFELDDVLGSEEPEPIAVPESASTAKGASKKKAEPESRGPSIALPDDLDFGGDDDEDEPSGSEVEVSFDSILDEDPLGEAEADDIAGESFDALVSEDPPSGPKIDVDEFEVDLDDDLVDDATPEVVEASEPAALDDTLTEEPQVSAAAISLDDEDDDVIAAEEVASAAPTPVAFDLDLDDDEEEEDVVAAIAEDDDDPVHEASPVDEDGIDDLLEQFPDDTVAQAEEAEEDGFDLAAELEQGHGASPSAEPAFADVFRAFKKGIEEQVSAEDAAAHYDLAIAYKEMGLYDDAIEALEKVARNGAMLVESMSLLATCKLEQGKADEAASVLMNALESATSANEKLALRYDLGLAYVSAGDTAKAKAAFEAVAEQDPDFREVQEQLADL